jgi:KDO2-lipid IV(A) lauroyltransferase
MYYLYRFGYFLAHVLPLKVSYFLADIAAVFYYVFVKRDKKIMMKNIRAVIGEDADDTEVNRYRFRVYRNFAKYLADFFRTPIFTEKFISENIEIRGKENIDKALAKGKGLILTSLHYGNWEWGGAMISGLGLPIKVVVLEHKSKKVNDFFVKQRKVNNVESIPLGLSVRECFKALKKNEVIGIVGDKDYTNTGVIIDFFNAPAVIPKGPAAISLKTGAPIIVAIMQRQENDKFILFFDKAELPEPSGNHETDLKGFMGAYMRIFEKYVRQDPGQWYAFRNIWI